jgi:NAD(P)-dependent dehydrogenase (short-subunit alcohol dehydrogenase family)
MDEKRGHMSLGGKITIVTGGGTRIGEACALRLSREGASVCAAGLERAQLDDVIKEIQAKGEKGLAVRADVGIVEDTERIVVEMVRQFGALHILVNNAATVDLSKPVEDITVEEWDRCLNASLRSIFLLFKWTAPHMRDLGAGSIINLGAVGAIMPWAQGAASSAP